jgi:TolB-like protein/Tfp pilus assembly protein PilF
MPGNHNRLSRFWREIKRRNVHRSLAVYAGSAFCFLEASTIIFPRWGFPDWAIDVLLYLLILGAVVTIFVSWVFDVTPEGIKRTRPVEEVPEEERIPVTNSWKIATYASLVVIIGLIVFNVFSRNRGSGELSDLENSIAVLPFENLFPDSSELWFTEGISDVISSQLTKISGYRLIDRKSTIKYKEEKRAIPEIGKELGVNYIILGTAQKQLNQIRIIVQLVRANNETQLWSEVYDREWKDFFDIQTDIATKIAGSLQTLLTPQETKQIKDLGTQNSEAYNLYMIGNHLMKQWNEDAFRRAIDNYERAIALDSNFAQAYAGAAMAYFELTTWDVPLPDLKYKPIAMDLALNALRLNNELGEAYYIIGAIKAYHEQDWKGAEEAFKKGMEYNPNFVYGRIAYANFLTLNRRFEESIALGRETLKLDPLDAGVYNELGYPLWLDGQDEEALELYNKSLDLNPGFDNAKALLLQFYAHKEIYNQFVADLCDDFMERYDNDPKGISGDDLGFYGKIYAMAGHQEEAKKMLNELLRRADQGEETSYLGIGDIYNAFGNYEKAIEYYEKSYDERELFRYLIYADYNIDSLRSDERFKALVKKLGFE